MTNAKRSPGADAVLRECIGLRLRMATRVVTKIYDDALRPFGLRIPQLAMLALAKERGVLRQADVCSELQFDDSTLSRNLERMQSRGWLKHAETGDGREHPYRLTDDGRDLLRRALPAWSQAQDEALEALGSRGVTAVRRFAERMGLRS